MARANPHRGGFMKWADRWRRSRRKEPIANFISRLGWSLVICLCGILGMGPLRWCAEQWFPHGPVIATAIGLIVVFQFARWVLRGKLPDPSRSRWPMLIGHPVRFASVYRWPLVLLLVGVTLDTLTTIACMMRWGLEAELHLAMRSMAEEYGIVEGVIIGSCIRVIFVLFIASWWRVACGWILAVCGCLYMLASASNHWGWL
jgi:hypothetical protein